MNVTVLTDVMARLPAATVMGVTFVPVKMATVAMALHVQVPFISPLLMEKCTIFSNLICSWKT